VVAQARTWVAVAELAVGLHLLHVAATSDLPPTGRLLFAAFVVGITGGAIALAVRGSRAGRASGMLIVGLLGTMSGAAVGVTHAVATGVSVAAVLGLAALAAGLVLLVGGAVALVRRLPGWWRLLAVPVALLVVQFVLLTVPMAVYATHVPVEPFTASPPPGTTFVLVEAADGVDLAAWYTPATNGAAVVLRHGSGAGSSRASTATHAAVLASRGYGVLAMDARGHGESAGRPMDWGWYGDADVAAGLTWLAARPEVDAHRLGGVGLSMGGEELLGAAGSDERLRAVVGEGVTGRSAADRDLLGHRGLVGAIDRLTAAITFGAADLMTRATRPTPLGTAVAAMGDTRVLLVTGDDPQEATVAHTLRERAAPGVVTIWELPETPHTGALARHADEWETRVIGFFDDALR
jgi:uncharacterized protein